jgi:hypothetical protein
LAWYRTHEIGHREIDLGRIGLTRVGYHDIRCIKAQAAWLDA